MRSILLAVFWLFVRALEFWVSIVFVILRLKVELLGGVHKSAEVCLAHWGAGTAITFIRLVAPLTTRGCHLVDTMQWGIRGDHEARLRFLVV